MKSSDQLMISISIKTDTNIHVQFTHEKRSRTITSARVKMPSIISHYYSFGSKNAHNIQVQAFSLPANDCK